MKHYQLALLVGLALSVAHAAWAQDATIVNARIAVGDGPVIEHGYIVVQNGRIALVAPGQPAQTAGTLIDAAGLTAVPGFIDGHKHLNTSPLGEKEQMQDLIENGFTTVLSALGPAQSNLDLIRKIQSGQINGPHIIASGRFNLHGTPEQAREAIRGMAAQGIHFTGEVAVTPVPTATPAELAVLRAAVDEGRKDGVEVLVHAVSSPAMVAATEAGVRHQVHLPNKDFMSYDQAAEIVNSGTRVLDLISFGDPLIDVFQQDDLPRFRTGLLWPESIAGANRDEQGRATGTEGAYTLINARRIWDASHGTGLGFGSDQNYPVHEVLEHELKSLMVMFSMQDVLRVLTINTASFLGMQNQIGTLEPFKQADILLVQGNPFADFNDLLRPVVVLKDGKVVVDKRTQRAAPEQLGAAGTPPASTEPLVGTLSASVARPDQPAATSCRQLSAQRLTQTRLTSANETAASSVQIPASPAGDRPARSEQVPAHCVVSAQIRPARGTTLRLELWLPVSGWNGSFLLVGSGSAPAPMALNGALVRGYAVAFTDTGAESSRDRPQQRMELANRAVHEGAQKSKALIMAYYGGTPRYSYWISGRADVQQGLKEVQAYPADFDGVVIGAPQEAQSASGVDAGAVDVSTFATRGGKIIEYHGGAAQPATASTDHLSAYQSLLAGSGGLEQTRRFYRLFLLPDGRDGDSYRVDWLTALDQWVQRDRAPDMVLANHIPPPNTGLAPPTGLVFEPRFGVHTICAYPNVATLQNGLGETPVDWLCLPAAGTAGQASEAGTPQ